MIVMTRTGQRMPLQIGDNLIGRGSDCQLRLEHERVSRRHAVIQWDGHQARVLDLGSTNGTTLNGKRLEPRRHYPFGPGDRLEIGGPEVVLEAALEEPISSTIDVQGSEPTRAPAVPVWLAAIAGMLFLLLIFLGALYWSANRAQQTPATPAFPTSVPVVQPAPMTPTPAPAASRPTATLAVPSATNAQPAAGVQPAVEARSAGASAAAVQLPPINPTTLPSLLSTMTGGLLPGDLTAFFGGTPIPGMPFGTSSAPLPAVSQRHKPPRLLGPASGSNYHGEEAVIILEWEAVSGLAADEYYWVMVFYQRDGREQAGGTWIKATSYRVPAWFLTQASGRFEWQVMIAQATGPVERGGRLGAKVSDPSERRWFSWQPGGSAPPPPPREPTPTYGG